MYGVSLDGQMKPLVSVAIAAYNVEDFVKKGVSYIQNQTYTNIEIILVDDGSTDSSGAICDELALEDKRIRVFHKENGGPGSARNVGIENANGKYICFMDVDDSVEPDFIEESVHVMEEKQSDLIIFGYYAKTKYSEEELISVSEREICCNAELKKAFCEELLWMKHGNGFAWNKFYRLSFLIENHFRFGSQRIQEDEIFNMQLYPKLERVYVCPKAYYHYVIYSSGNASSSYLPNKADILTDVYYRFMDLYNLWNLDDGRVLQYIQKRYVSSIFGVVTRNYFHEKCPYSNKQRKNVIQKELSRQELNVCLRNVEVSFKGNIVNRLIRWAFFHKKINLLIWSVKLKKWLKMIFRKG